MIILALDPSSTNVGYCLAEDAGYILSGCFKPKGKTAARMLAIADWAQHKIAAFSVTHVVLEEPAGNHGNAHTNRLLGGVRWLISIEALRAGAQIDKIYPSQVKATGCHKDSCTFTARLVEKAEVGEDEADAVGVWQAYLTKLQKERFEKL